MAKKPAKKIAVKKSSSAGKPAPIAKATPADGSDRQQLADVIRAQTGCTAVAARETVKALLETLSASLKKNQKVQLVGFGTFTVAKRGARKGINPRTGESINIKASKSVRFKAGQALKKSL
jgi:DNA-binding protein HU-beta